MTCAAHVQACGQGFPGQLGVFSERHVPGLTRLASSIRAHGSASCVQLHHAGCRSPRDLVAAPVCASDDAPTGARGLSVTEVEEVVEDFIAAAQRCERAGFDGVEIHGAHGYLLTQFLSCDTNRRDDRYGGPLVNRARIVLDILEGVRSRCRPDFQVGLRISPERYGIRLEDALELARIVLATGSLDYLDVSLWDIVKAPEEEAHRVEGKSLLSYFTALDRGATRLGVAGKVRTPADAAAALDAGVDFALLGRAAILNHDFPRRAAADPTFVPATLPVTRAHLRQEGLGRAFIDYMTESRWGGFVCEEEGGEAGGDGGGASAAPFPLPPLQTGACVWDASSPRPPPWVLSPDDLVALRTAADAVVASSPGEELSLSAVDAAVTTLPARLISRLTRVCDEELLRGCGYTLIRGIPVGTWGDAISAAAFLVLTRTMGTLRQQNSAGHILGHVTDLGLSSSDPSVRVYQTHERQTFHADSSSEEAQGKASPLPQTVLVNRGGTMVQVHLIGKKSHRKKPLRYTEKEARSPDSPGLHRLRLWGLLKRKRKLQPSPPPQRHEVSTRMLEYSQRVKHSFSPTVSAEKQLELQLRGSDLLPLQIQRVSLNLLCRTTKV